MAWATLPLAPERSLHLALGSATVLALLPQAALAELAVSLAWLLLAVTWSMTE